MYTYSVLLLVILLAQFGAGIAALVGKNLFSMMRRMFLGLMIMIMMMLMISLKMIIMCTQVLRSDLGSSIGKGMKDAMGR